MSKKGYKMDKRGRDARSHLAERRLAENRAFAIAFLERMNKQEELKKNKMI